MKRYFKANVEDAVRIAVYEGTTRDDIQECLWLGAEDREIFESDLPEDFRDWKRYDIGCYGIGLRTVVMETLSRDGE